MDPIDLILSGEQKRFFRATRKINTPNYVSHITQRAAGKEPLFVEDKDYLYMMWLMKEISHNYDLRIYAFCLMENHIHLLCSPIKDNLYDAMRDLFSRYAMKFNRKYERKGHLFGGPYRQAVCLHDSYLLAASLYIHLNPVNAGISQDPLQYRWSSCRLYCDGNAPKAFVKPDLILSLLPGNIEERKEQYQRLLKNGMGLNIGHVFEQEDAIERFRSKVASLFPLLFKRIDKKRKVLHHLDLDISEVEDIEMQINNVKAGQFQSKPESIQAKKFLIEQLISRGYKKTEIAELLEVSRKTIYNTLKSRGRGGRS